MDTIEVISSLKKRPILAAAVVAAAYFATAKLGFSLAFATKQVTAVWPPTAIALVAYLIFGFRVWPAVFIAAFLVNASSNEPIVTAAGIAVGNTLAGIVGISLLRKFVRFSPTLDKITSVLGLLAFGAAAGAIVSASNGVLHLAMGGIIEWTAYPSVWWVWWVGDTMGVMLLAPLLLTCMTKQTSIKENRLIELAVLLTLLCGVSYATLDGRAIYTASVFKFAYAVFPFVMWAALRFSQREAALAVVIVSVFAIQGAIHDSGPFAAGTLDSRLIFLELFMAVTAITGLVLAASVAERKHAESALQRAHDELEVRVEQRTMELARSNRELAEKNEEVEAFVYTVSHDLRAPLVNLQGFSRELQSSCADLEQAIVSTSGSVSTTIKNILKEDIPGALHFITASATKFERLIDALLMLSRYGRQTYKTEYIDMHSLMNATIDSLQQSILDKGATVRIANTLPNANGDITAVGQIVSNLVGNALKYLDPSRSGIIEIGGNLQDGMSHYWVRDNGAGIPETAKPRLFQIFQRFHPELASGEGMGLAIVKRIVERHGGSICVESTIGQGTTFHFTLTTSD